MSASLGMIETVGLAAAITAADAAAKSANVQVLGYELTRGGGLVTVKFTGDVSAVKAALDAAVAAAQSIGTVYSRLVIPRPDDQLETLMTNKHKSAARDPEVTTDKSAGKSRKEKKTGTDSSGENIKSTDLPQEYVADKSKLPTDATEKESEEVCNLCHDPACPRKKGDLRTKCIHFND
ncbi:BMC domain-containing protein [Thermoactinomyces mirandus]|uniref:BMC domain-containing protein n=1 Tax=Thermoactinomyces mirandus TaxID=2756294 RepID=UPI0024842116|nr:BMC domain-containing protein [Thermoactinomyces mirandus]